MDKIIHLSVTKKSVPVRFDWVQYATAPNILFVIDDYVPGPGAQANIYIEKPDGTKIYNTCQVEENRIIYTPTTQSFAALGTNRCQLQIVEARTIISFLIYAEVTENIIDAGAIESKDEFTALEEALQTVSDYDGRITENAEAIAANTEAIEVNAQAILNLINDLSYKAGDTESVPINTAGNITGSAKSVRFYVPLRKKIPANVTVAVSSHNTFALRGINGNVTYTDPPTVTVSKVDAYGILVQADFASLTNATNNTPIAISVTLQLAFS